MSERRHEPRRRPWPVRNSGQLLLIAAAGVVLVASVAQTAVAGVRDTRIAFAFGALIAFGEVLRLNLPGDRESAPIGIAGALAYALLIRVGGYQVMHSAEQVVTVTAIGMIIGALPHLAVGGRPRSAAWPRGCSASRPSRSSSARSRTATPSPATGVWRSR